MQLRSGKITSKSSSSVFCKKNANMETELCATKAEFVKIGKQTIDFCTTQTKSLGRERFIWHTKINDFITRHVQYYTTCDQMQNIVDVCINKEKDLVSTLCFNNLDHTHTHVLNYYNSLVRLRKCMEQNMASRHSPQLKLEWPKLKSPL